MFMENPRQMFNSDPKTSKLIQELQTSLTGTTGSTRIIHNNNKIVAAVAFGLNV
jgi:hypothetical protein